MIICFSKSDPKSRDEHLLKQVKRALSNCNNQEFLQLTSQLSTSTARIQAFEIAAKSKALTPELLESAVSEFMEKLDAIGKILYLMSLSLEFTSV